MNLLDVLKDSIRMVCSPRLQSQLRLLYVTRQVLKNQNFHEPEMALLKSLVQAGDHVADIGANVGAYTMELSRLVGASGHVYSFEPISENFNILQTVIRKANLMNVAPIYAALGSISEQRQMVIPESPAFTGFYLAHLAQDGDQGRRMTVDVLTLDELWKKNKIKDLNFVKCDVEGGELEVLRGGLQLIESQRPGWLLEVSRETSGEVFRSLQALGYKAFVYRDMLVQTDSYRDKEFSNYFFFHPRSKIWDRVLLLTMTARQH
jgi:FkbM family methyltransferase